MTLGVQQPRGLRAARAGGEGRAGAGQGFPEELGCQGWHKVNFSSLVEAESQTPIPSVCAVVFSSFLLKGRGPVKAQKTNHKIIPAGKGLQDLGSNNPPAPPLNHSPKEQHLHIQTPPQRGTPLFPGQLLQCWNCIHLALGTKANIPAFSINPECITCKDTDRCSLS